MFLLNLISNHDTKVLSDLIWTLYSLDKVVRFSCNAKIVAILKRTGAPTYLKEVFFLEHFMYYCSLRIACVFSTKLYKYIVLQFLSPLTQLKPNRVLTLSALRCFFLLQNMKVNPRKFHGHCTNSKFSEALFNF